MNQDHFDDEFEYSIRVIRTSLQQAEAGQVRPMRDFIEELARKHGISLDPNEPRADGAD